MNIKIVDKGDKPVEWIRFVIDGEEVTPTLVNSLRRVLRAEVPVFAIENIMFKKNSSVLYDEMLALRLGLIPITTPTDYVPPWVCNCGSHCPKCSVSLMLKKKGPGWITTKDFKSQDPKVKAVYPDIPIVYLTEFQEIDLEAIAQIGVGKMHMKWQAALAAYQSYPEIKINKNVTKEGLEACPREVFDVKGNKVKNLLNCNLCMACVQANPEGIEVKPKPNAFILYVESFGQIPLKDVLKGASEVLQEKADSFIEALKEEGKKK